MSDSNSSCTRYSAIRYNKLLTLGRVLKRLLHLGSKIDAKVCRIIILIAILVRTDLKHSILRKSILGKRDFTRNKR